MPGGLDPPPPDCGSTRTILGGVAGLPGAIPLAAADWGAGVRDPQPARASTHATARIEGDGLRRVDGGDGGTGALAL